MNFYEFINREELEEIRHIREQIQVLKRLKNRENLELEQDTLRCFIFEQQMFDEVNEMFT
ncbi:hypothetical protein J4434_02235 [Candidatus Woesearchaeota archaeon]|nr:hypothetical protein [Candidatus Woesearchaeota archaeon]